jgi:hypothetical protein
VIYFPSDTVIQYTHRYIFSDGLAHDMSLFLDMVEMRKQNQQKCPMIHTVGEQYFFRRSSYEEGTTHCFFSDSSPRL